MKPITPARIARIFERCSTVRRSLLASRRVRAMGLEHLSDALFARAMELRAGTTYPAARNEWARLRFAALGRIDTEPEQ